MNTEKKLFARTFSPLAHDEIDPQGGFYVQSGKWYEIVQSDELYNPYGMIGAFVKGLEVMPEAEELFGKDAEQIEQEAEEELTDPIFGFETAPEGFDGIIVLNAGEEDNEGNIITDDFLHFGGMWETREFPADVNPNA